MKHLLLPLLIAFLAACGNNNPSTNNAHQSSDSTVVDSTNQSDLITDAETKVIEIKGDTGNGYFNMISPVVFANKTSLYEKPDSASKVLATLNFNTPVEIADLNGFWNGWYEVSVHNQKGFMPAAVIATRKFTTHIKGDEFNYFIIAAHSEKYNPGQGFTIYKYNALHKRFTDTLTVNDYRADIAKAMSCTSWKNADFLFRTEQIQAYCGGGTTELYIVDANGQMKELFTTYEFADDGEEGGGYFASAVFPKNVTTDTIVRHEYGETGVYKNGRALKNKDGSYKMKIVDDTTTYYRWNGKELMTVKTVAGK